MFNSIKSYKEFRKMKIKEKRDLNNRRLLVMINKEFNKVEEVGIDFREYLDRNLKVVNVGFSLRVLVLKREKLKCCSIIYFLFYIKDNRKVGFI